MDARRPHRAGRWYRQALKDQLPELTQAAAKAISEASVLLLASGAGFSADSGLAVYMVRLSSMCAFFALASAALLLLVVATPILLKLVRRAATSPTCQ